MEEFLKHYRMRIEALSPIYIGSGVKLGKKEYIYMPWNHEVIIPDMQKMFLAVQKKGVIKEYTRTSQSFKRTWSQHFISGAAPQPAYCRL